MEKKDFATQPLNFKVDRAVPKKSILVVEDEEDLRLLLVEVLEGEGARVYSAANGELALSIFAEKKIDVIVSDVMMPVMDGVTLSYKICELTKDFFNKPKLFFLTGSEAPDLPVGLQKALNIEVLRKPFQFQAMVHQVMGRGKGVVALPH